MPKTPSVFICHSSLDKPAARRLYYRLRAYGLDVWFDEVGITMGDEIPAIIRSNILDSDFMLVLMSSNSINSSAVLKELRVAKEFETRVKLLPFYIEDVAGEKSNCNKMVSHLRRFDAIDKHSFESIIQKVLSFIGEKTSWVPEFQADRACEDFAVAQGNEPLLTHVLDSYQIESVSRLNFHSLDYALITAYETSPHAERKSVAYHAARIFPINGSGSWVLRQHVASGVPDVQAVCCAVDCELKESEFDVAIELIVGSDPPNYQAMMHFLPRNAEFLKSRQNEELVSLVVSNRNSPAPFLIDAAFALLRYSRETKAVEKMIIDWIRSGALDAGKQLISNPDKFTRIALSYLDASSPILNRIGDEFIRRTKVLAKSPDRVRIYWAITHVFSATECRAPWLSRAIEECVNAASTDSWGEWAEGKEMSIYLYCLTDAARNGHTEADGVRKYKAKWKQICSGEFE